MNDDYQALLDEYTAAALALLEQPAAPVRGAAPVVPDVDALVTQADRVSDLSTALKQQVTPYLSDESEAVRLGAEQHLLAQAVLDLQLADRFLNIAAVAGETEAPPLTRAARAPMPTVDPVAILRMPLEEGGQRLLSPAPVRGVAREASAEDVIQAADVAISELLDHVVDFGQDAISGLLGLDTALLKEAATLISAELGELVQKLGEQASRLVAKAITFIVRAYDSLLAAIGQDMASEMRQRVAQWLVRLQEGENIAGLVGTMYTVEAARLRVRHAVDQSSAPAIVLGQARDAVDALPGAFAERTTLMRQLLAGLGLIKRFPAARVPMAELASASLYLLLLGVMVLIGADYLDAPRLDRLQRVPGVPEVVESSLGLS